MQTLKDLPGILKSGQGHQKLLWKRIANSVEVITMQTLKDLPVILKSGQGHQNCWLKVHCKLNRWMKCWKRTFPDFPNKEKKEKKNSIEVIIIVQTLKDLTEITSRKKSFVLLPWRDWPIPTDGQTLLLSQSDRLARFFTRVKMKNDETVDSWRTSTSESTKVQGTGFQEMLYRPFLI